jgi:hypothetical protein
MTGIGLGDYSTIGDKPGLSTSFGPVLNKFSATNPEVETIESH